MLFERLSNCIPFTGGLFNAKFKGNGLEPKVLPRMGSSN